MTDTTQYRDSGATLPSSDNSQRKVLRVPRERVRGSKEIWDKYICPKCDNLLEEAVQCACGHRLCRVCAVEIFNE